MVSPRPEKRSRKKKKPPKKFRLSYSLLLLLAMIVVGAVTGLVAYRFGKLALEGVNPSPAGIKLPKISPTAKPKESPKSSPSGQNSKTSLFLDEQEVITGMKARSQQELGNLTRPNFVAKVNNSDRRTLISARVDQAYNSMRDPLAISANADERIAERIAELRQRVYASSRSYEGNFDRPSVSPLLLSTPVELTPIRNRWQDRDAALVSPTKKLNFETSQPISQPDTKLTKP